ncbi:MAG: hypothetical protein GY749_02555 [Desulfobacteraceae bacterium]|nr:hypothetical protein [Desulfobacteraceae bacterium]
MRYACEEVNVTAEIQGTECVIHIDDDGPGIVAEDRERIFEPFVRLDTSRDRKSGGYGLGLAIARRIMQWHNGSVDTGSSLAGGARFTLRWPGCTK